MPLRPGDAVWHAYPMCNISSELWLSSSNIHECQRKHWLGFQGTVFWTGVWFCMLCCCCLVVSLCVFCLFSKLWPFCTALLRSLFFQSEDLFLMAKYAGRPVFYVDYNFGLAGKQFFLFFFSNDKSPCAKFWPCREGKIWGSKWSIGKIQILINTVRI